MKLTKAEMNPTALPNAAETKNIAKKRNNANCIVSNEFKCSKAGFSISNAVDANTIATASFNIDSPNASIYNCTSTF